MSQKPIDLSVIIPFKDHSDLTIPCLETLIKFSSPIKEILLVSNNSNESELALVQEAASKYPNTRVLVYNHPFNFHKINNWAAKQATSSVFLFLNNDIELTPSSNTIISGMYEQALKPSTGAVGAVLLYEDQKTIQHAGVYLVPGGTADHLYIGKKLTSVKRKILDETYKYDTTKDLTVAAVTAAAVMVEKNKFERIKGFNEDFIVGGGDVDLCLRLMRAGKKNILIGSDKGYMIHKESKTRSLVNVPYVDFVESYKSYIQNFDTTKGDNLINWKSMPHD